MDYKKVTAAAGLLEDTAMFHIAVNSSDPNTKFQYSSGCKILQQHAYNSQLQIAKALADQMKQKEDNNYEKDCGRNS